MPPKREKPKLIICEGITDKAFFSELLKLYSIDEIQVHEAGGNSKFAEALRGARVELFKSVLLVSDCNGDPNHAFRDVCSEIRKADYTAPSQPLEMVPADGITPSLTVLMIPWEGEEGTIETVCLPAIEQLFPAETNCLDTFCMCTHTDTWTIKARSQMRVECLIASTYLAQPQIGFGYWLKHNCPIDLKHPCFARVANVISHFVALSV